MLRKESLGRDAVEKQEFLNIRFVSGLAIEEEMKGSRRSVHAMRNA